MARGEFGGSRYESQRYTGTEYEYDMFDQIDVKNPAYLADLAKVTKPDGHVTFKDAVWLAKKHQPTDSSNPRKDFFRELLFAVQEKLGVDPDQNPDALHAYTAVGSVLDKKHSVDAFMTYDDKGREVIVTLDATRRPEKLKEGWKADVMVGDIPEVDDDSGAYMDRIDEIAGDIAKKLLTEERDDRQGARW